MGFWLETFKMLMDYSEVKNPFDESDIDGRTPLHDAAEGGLKDFVEVIMDAVEEKCPTTTGHEFTPLHLAARKGHFEVCQLINELIPENKNMRDRHGKTPADLARDRAGRHELPIEDESYRPDSGQSLTSSTIR